MPLRSRAFRRFHTDRVIANRVAQAKALCWWQDPDWEPVPGRLSDHQHYVGCHRPRCGVCHPEKRWNYGDRERQEREWRKSEGLL